MKQLLTISVFFSVLFFNISFSQEGPEIVLTNLRAPSSPASKIMGNDPNDITRPKSWNELEVSLFTDFFTQENNINLNRLINLEVSPYWLKKNRKLTTAEFIFQDDPLENLKQNFTVSFATSNNFIIPDSIGQQNTSLALGVRTMLWKGTKLEKGVLAQRYNALKEDLKFTTRLLPILGSVNCNNCTKENYVANFLSALYERKNQMFGSSISDAKITETLDRLKHHLLKNLDSFSKDGSSYMDYIDGLAENSYFSELEQNLLSLEEMIADRKGFKLEVAAAVVIDFPSNKTDFSTIPQFSLWVTPSFQPFNIDWIEFLGVLKYSAYFQDYYRPILLQPEYRDNALDLGFKLVLKAERFSFEVEGITRQERNFITDDNLKYHERDKSNSKYITRVNYRVTDQLVLTYDFGRDFSLVGTEDYNLISQFALNYALGAIKKKDLNNGK